LRTSTDTHGTVAWWTANSARPAPHRARALGVRADHEARLVDEVGDRQAELVAQVDEAHELARGVAGQAAASVSA
jgi:hypothetical protein